MSPAKRTDEATPEELKGVSEQARRLGKAIAADASEAAAGLADLSAADVVFTPSPKLEESVMTAAEQAKVDAETRRGYRIGRWAGKPNYECLVCPFSTLDQMVVEDHVNDHRMGLPRRYVDTGLVGENGNPIVRVEESEG